MACCTSSLVQISGSQAPLEAMVGHCCLCSTFICFCLLASELVTKTTSYNGLMLTACGRQQKYLKIKNAVFLIYIHLYVQRCDLVRWRKKRPI